jgi:hypothetical protein
MPGGRHRAARNAPPRQLGDVARGDHRLVPRVSLPRSA